jgi:hypothetical protein
MGSHHCRAEAVHAVLYHVHSHVTVLEGLLRVTNRSMGSCWNSTCELVLGRSEG